MNALNIKIMYEVVYFYILITPFFVYPLLHDDFMIETTVMCVGRDWIMWCSFFSFFFFREKTKNIFKIFCATFIKKVK